MQPPVLCAEEHLLLSTLSCCMYSHHKKAPPGSFGRKFHSDMPGWCSHNIIWYKAFWYFEPKSICIDNDDDNDGICYGDGDGGGDDDGDGDDVGEQMIGNWRGGVKGLLRGGSRGIGWWDHQHFLLIMIIIIMSSWSYHHHMIIIIWTWSYHHHINVVIIWSSIWPLGVAAQLLWGCGILIVSSSFL